MFLFVENFDNENCFKSGNFSFRSENNLKCISAMQTSLISAYTLCAKAAKFIVEIYKHISSLL